ncbi:hypothetical protein BaRGS_00010481 [Batillaria attramentaria]|uniref:Uncharacterized protein n=1 Tax=Batillaria attramentaria TaxID=370345 RepID=A0ABD0LFF0_9CAEN
MPVVPGPSEKFPSRAADSDSLGVKESSYGTFRLAVWFNSWGKFAKKVGSVVDFSRENINYETIHMYVTTHQLPNFDVSGACKARCQFVYARFLHSKVNIVVIDYPGFDTLSIQTLSPAIHTICCVIINHRDPESWSLNSSVSRGFPVLLLLNNSPCMSGGEGPNGHTRQGSIIQH